MKSIRGKILSSMTLTVVFALLLTGITSIYYNYKSTIELLEQDMVRLAAVSAQRVQYELEAYTNVAYDTGSIARLANSDTSLENKREIMEQRAATHGLVGYNIVGADGISIFDGNNYSDRDYYQRALRGDAYVSVPLISKVTGKPSVMVAAPLWEGGIPDTKVAGVVYFKPPETFLNDIVNSLKISTNGSAYILDANGTIIAHRDMEQVTSSVNNQQMAKSDTSLSAVAALERKMTAGETGFGEYTGSGQRLFLAYAPINGTDGWSIAVNAPIADFTDSVIRSMVMIAALLIITAVVAVMIAVVLALSISRPILLCCQRLELLAEGDLNSPVPQIKGRDETGRLAGSTDTIVTSIRGIISDIGWSMGELANGNFTALSQKEELYQGDFKQIPLAIKNLVSHMSDTLSQVRLAAEQVAASSEQVSAGSQSLSQGATEQASSVEELAATISELSDGVKATAEKTEEAKSETMVAGAKMSVAIDEMQTLITAMNEISDSSAEIGKVIKTIEDIAFQTNILALNAAVEAARAGAAGKGFAVVADEVRNLATKSAEASKGTEALIKDSIRAVERGTELANSTAQAIAEVSVNTRQAGIMVDSIAKAMQEQSIGLEQIAQGVVQISGVVQANSATAEESAAASEELSGQSQLLEGEVGRFQLLA